MTFAWRISRLRMRCACFSLANSGACAPSSLSQTYRIHSEGMMTFGPESAAQRKPSKVDTSIAFSRPSSASRNTSSSSISRLVSGPDLIGFIGQSHFITTTCRLITQPLYGNNARAHPATENTALAAAAASLDLDEASLRLIDRVYSSKLQDHPPDDLAAIQQRLYGYFRKFGRGDDGRPIANPHPPDPHVAATLLAIAELNRLETMLDNLELDAMATKAYLPSTKSSLNPYSYGWFSIIALSRIHGIHFHKTKKARAALRDVKRKPRQPQPEQIDLPDIAALAKQKAMQIGRAHV